MSERDVLERLAAVPGVRGACLATADGALLDGVGEPVDALASVAAAAADALDAGREVGDLYAAGAARSVAVTYDAGVVLAVPLEGEGEAGVLALRLADRTALGRARREADGAVRRLFPGAAPP